MGSCTADELVPQVPLTVSFSVDEVAGLEVRSSGGGVEQVVKDVNLYILNEAGHVVSYGHYPQGGGIRATIYDGMRYSIYAIANAGVPLPAKDMDEIESLDFTLSSQSWMAGADGVILMSGRLPLQEMRGGGDITVPLERCAAKVVLKCDFSALNDDVTIDVSSIRLGNIPCRVGIFRESRVVSADGAMDGIPVANPSADALKEGIPFYLLENMQGNLHSGNTSQSGKVWPQGSLNSRICSYVEMKASYASPRKAGDILYRFYLGKDMHANYDVQRNVQYDITVRFRGDGAIDENSWRVDAGGLRDVVPPQISFGENSRVMYDLEEGVLKFATLKPEGVKVSAVSSDNSVVQVVESSSGGVRLKALSPGKATITASAGGVSTSCTIDVEKLRIVPHSSSVTLYNHFYTDIPYTVYPAHAASLGVEFSSSITSIQIGFGGVHGRVIPQYNVAENLPATAGITLSVAGRSDVKAYVAVTVNPMLSINGEVVANANLGSAAAVSDLGLSTSPHAGVDFSWVPSDGFTIYGDPGSNVAVSAEENTLTFPVPNGANGRYRLRAAVLGDDGYGSNEQSHTDAVKYCDVTIYETIYLVGVSKTMGREKIDTDPDKWRYENEVVAKWLSHPKSLMFPSGELNLSLGFVYKGVTYTDSHTEFAEEFTFTFEKGDYVYYALDTGFSIYQGTPPGYYMEYFSLEPASSRYVQGSLLEGKPFLYIYSRNFASGFSNEPSTDWEKIFEYVYP